jgi:hypothetical protein
LTLQIDGTSVVVSHGPHPNDETVVTTLLEARSRRQVPQAAVTVLREYAKDRAATEVPQEVGTLCSEIHAGHRAACRTALELLRWRYRSDSPHAPYGSLGSEWADDDMVWLPVPAEYDVEMRIGRGALLTSDAQAEVRRLASGGLREPVAHQLLREAIDVSAGNVRSSVVICIAAVESGFKHLVTDLVPHASWLVENLPSPPLLKMLSDYLPSLPVRNRFDQGKVYGPPKYVRRLLQRAVEDRNKVAHTGSSTLDWRELKETLDAAGDLLYLFDYYAGQAWALEHVSKRFRDSLGA